MEDDDDDKALLGSLGVTTVDSEAIEHEILSQVKHCINDASVQSGEGLEHDIEHKVTDSSSSNFVRLYHKLRAVEVEIHAVGSSIPEEKNEETRDDPKCRVETGDLNPAGLSLQQELAKDRIRSLQRTKAQLQKEISQLKEHDSTRDFVLDKLVYSLVKERPNRKLKNKMEEKSNKNSQKHQKVVSYQDDLYFDAVLDAGSAGFVETEREELIRKGILTPFHKIKGFERRLQLPGTSKDELVEDSIDNLASSSIAKVAQSLADIANHRPTTKLLDAKHLPKLDPPTQPFQRLRKPQKILPSTEKKRKKGRNSRPSPHKKWREVGTLKKEVPDGSDGVGNASDYCEEKQNDSDSSTDEEESYVVLEGGLKIPSSVFSKLFDYQKVGAQWLWELHCQKAGGIIGDEMGLGKTIQVISFLAALHYSKMYKPSIVVCPVTLLRQWKREVQKWYPFLDVEILHDSAHSQPLAKCSDSDYESEASMDSSIERIHTAKPKKRWDDMIDRIEKSESGLLLTSYEQLRIHSEKLLDIEWGYAILDEGHRIRNPNADVTLVCKQLQTVHRIIMTGAPIQNKLSELWSLFDFVFPGKLGVLPVFETEFAVPITVGGYANATPLQVSTAYRCAVVLRDLIMPYLLRRMKADVHVQLPKKTEHVLFCSLTREQSSVYRAFLASSEVEQIFDGSRNSLYGIDVMRKICNHPDLLERDYSHQNLDYGNPERSGKMRVVVQVLEAWKEQGHRVLFFTQTQQMLDIVESFLRKNAYSYRRMDGRTPVRQRMELMDEFNNSSEIFIFILTTKVGGLGTNLTGADRVILYDPDWNPSTDMQARERAWRIGQRRDVTVYRLITRGTIEEKVYHRQIYKHFLTNKILKNPQQRRFFKAKDMKDLFTLQDVGDESVTETSNIFGQLAGELNLNDGNNLDGQASPANGTNPPEGDFQEGSGQSNGSDNEATNILKSLFDAQGIHSAINHDAIMNAPDNINNARMEDEAARVARRAAEALRESRVLRGRESFSLPTWTGRSGVAGAPSTVHRKFGSAVNSHLLGASRHQGSSSAGASTGRAMSSAELLAGVRARQEGAAGDALEQELASGGSRENARALERASTPPPNRLTVVQPEVMVRRLCSFMQRKGGESDSASITQHFKERIQSKDLPLFKSLLKQIATLEKDASGSRWVLKPDYMEQ